mmetsp:Transcript_67877/g.126829  ORF Transcript_67877/g.126829 Transcript_67877/m.126829 type:complete len:828 (+) Transcript_67877:34-2517(+)
MNCAATVVAASASGAIVAARDPQAHVGPLPNAGSLVAPVAATTRATSPCVRVVQQVQVPVRRLQVPQRTLLAQPSRAPPPRSVVSQVLQPAYLPQGVTISNSATSWSLSGQGTPAAPGPLVVREFARSGSEEALLAWYREHRSHDNPCAVDASRLGMTQSWHPGVHAIDSERIQRLDTVQSTKPKDPPPAAAASQIPLWTRLLQKYGLSEDSPPSNRSRAGVDLEERPDSPKLSMLELAGWVRRKLSTDFGNLKVAALVAAMHMKLCTAQEIDDHLHTSLKLARGAAPGNSAIPTDSEIESELPRVKFSEEEFVQALMGVLNTTLSRQSVERLFRLLDVERVGAVELNDLLHWDKLARQAWQSDAPMDEASARVMRKRISKGADMARCSSDPELDIAQTLAAEDPDKTGLLDSTAVSVGERKKRPSVRKGLRQSVSQARGSSSNWTSAKLASLLKAEVPPGIKLTEEVNEMLKTALHDSTAPAVESSIKSRGESVDRGRASSRGRPTGAGSVNVRRPKTALQESSTARGGSVALRRPFANGSLTPTDPLGGSLPSERIREGMAVMRTSKGAKKGKLSGAVPASSRQSTPQRHTSPPRPVSRGAGSLNLMHGMTSPGPVIVESLETLQSLQPLQSLLAFKQSLEQNQCKGQWTEGAEKASSVEGDKATVTPATTSGECLATQQVSSTSFETPVESVESVENEPALCSDRTMPQEGAAVKALSTRRQSTGSSTSPRMFQQVRVCMPDTATLRPTDSPGPLPSRVRYTLRPASSMQAPAKVAKMASAALTPPVSEVPPTAAPHIVTRSVITASPVGTARGPATSAYVVKQ